MLGLALASGEQPEYLDTPVALIHYIQVSSRVNCDARRFLQLAGLVADLTD